MIPNSKTVYKPNLLDIKLAVIEIKNKTNNTITFHTEERKAIKTLFIIITRKNIIEILEIIFAFISTIFLIIN